MSWDLLGSYFAAFLGSEDLTCYDIIHDRYYQHCRVQKKQHYCQCQWQVSLLSLLKDYCHNNKSIDSLILHSKRQNMQRKIGGVRTDAVILIIEMKINKETSGERSLRFLLENEKQNEIKGFFFLTSSVNYLKRIIKVTWQYRGQLP